MKLKNIGLMMLAIFLSFTVFVNGTEAATKKFKDLKQVPWAIDDIDYLTKKNVLAGYGDDTFRPMEAIKRAHAAKILADVLELDDKNIVDPKYTDVPKSHPQYKEIALLTEAGIISGSGQKFNPEGSLSRAELASILSRTYSLTGTKQSKWNDVSQDHWSYDSVDALYVYGVANGFGGNLFKPDTATTRAEFASFLVRAINADEPVVRIPELLKEVYENEMNLESYEMKGNVNFGLRLPEVLEEDEEFNSGFVTELLKSVKVEIDGAYQLNPNLTEMDLKVTLGEDVSTTFVITVIMNEAKLWIKLPDLPMLGIPAELSNKFIEIDANELAELEGVEIPPTDLEAEKDLVRTIYALLFDQFGNDFYSFANKNEITLPSGLEAKHILKFEVTNETMEPFIEKLFGQFIPALLDRMADPKIAAQLGIEAEDLKLMQEELANIELPMEDIIEMLDIHTFNQYIAINNDHQIVYDASDINLDIKAEGEKLGLMLNAIVEKRNINQKVTFKNGLPKADEVIKLAELEALFPDYLGEDAEEIE